MLIYSASNINLRSIAIASIKGVDLWSCASAALSGIMRNVSGSCPLAKMRALFAATVKDSLISKRKLSKKLKERKFNNINLNSSLLKCILMIICG